MRRLSSVLFLLIILSFAGVSVAHAQSLTFLCAGMNHPCVDIFTNEEMRPFPPEPADPVTIKIHLPQPGDKFFFNSRQPGTMEIIAVAVVEPSEYADQVEWEMDDIRSSTQTVEPSRGASVTIKFEALPENNNDFGDKTITASVGGKSDSVTVQVFFWPEATNHPGEGQGETPNWFYYWSQTKAAHGHSKFFRYVSYIGAKVVGRYVADEDRLLLSDLVVEHDKCTERGVYQAHRGFATGIDCFGEIVRHEWQHRVEQMRWWKGVNMFAWLARDFDRDLLPRDVEMSAPCSPKKYGVQCGHCVDAPAVPFGDDPQRSCKARPFSDVRDREIYAYYAGWDWVITSADSEDWSFCGKQWRKTSPGDCQ